MGTTHSLAKRNGSPLLLELHLLSALLMTPSVALDKTLSYLGTSRDALQATLQQFRHIPGTPTPLSKFPV
jgi:hypothetical protein